MRRGDAAQPKEEDIVPRSDTKDFMTKAEYNRWLVRQVRRATFSLLSLSR